MRSAAFSSFVSAGLFVLLLAASLPAALSAASPADMPGTPIRVDPADLPPPYATDSVSNAASRPEPCGVEIRCPSIRFDSENAPRGNATSRDPAYRCDGCQAE